MQCRIEQQSPHRVTETYSPAILKSSDCGRTHTFLHKSILLILSRQATLYAKESLGGRDSMKRLCFLSYNSHSIAQD